MEEATHKAEEISQATLAEFYKDAADRFGEWVKYGDTKAGAVFVVLGLGLSNLLDNADPLIGARRDSSDWGLTASVGFWAAIAAAILAAGVASLATLPHTKPSKSSLFYFGTVAHLKFEEYVGNDEDALRKGTMTNEIASQAWQLARIARVKPILTRLALLFGFLFVVSWIVARVGLALA